MTEVKLEVCMWGSTPNYVHNYLYQITLQILKEQMKKFNVNIKHKLPFRHQYFEVHLASMRKQFNVLKKSSSFSSGQG